MLTEKGRFVLDCINQGLHLTLDEYGRLWEQRQNTPNRRYEKCDRCGGTGRVLAAVKGEMYEDRI